ncbi:MAG: hypothetical protein ACHQ1H_02065 [Nitrososphaerales archaeon]
MATTEIANIEGKDDNSGSKTSEILSTDGKNQLIIYWTKFQEYLTKIDAKVENYKFSIEKTDNGLSLDCYFKATIVPIAS